MGALFLLAPASLTASVSIENVTLSQGSARDGQTITIHYQISSDSTRNAVLGAMLIGPNNGPNVDDPTNEHMAHDQITLQPGTHSYQRDFFINLPPGAPTGSYAVEGEVHWGTSGFTSQRQNNALTIQQPVSLSVPVLMYHKVGDTAHSEFWVTAQQLESHIQAVLEAGYTPITLTEWMEIRAGDRTGPGKPILITFDDGYEDLYTHVRPIVERLNVPVTAFINPALVGQTNSWDPGIDFNQEPEVRHATWNQLQTLHQTGLFDMQSHSNTHANFLSINQNERRNELRTSKEEIESRFGNEVLFIAYPWGAGAQAEHDIVHRDTHETGYFAAFGTDNVPQTQGGPKYSLHRHDIHWEVTANPNPSNPENYLFGPALLDESGQGGSEGFHPADTNSDWRIDDLELSGYAYEFLQGGHSDDLGLSRAAYIFLETGNGAYSYDGNGSGSNVWVPRN